MPTQDLVVCVCVWVCEDCVVARQTVLIIIAQHNLKRAHTTCPTVWVDEESNSETNRKSNKKIIKWNSVEQVFPCAKREYLRLRWCGLACCCCCCLQIDTFTHMSERVPPHLNSPRPLIVVKIVTGAKRRFIDLWAGVERRGKGEWLIDDWLWYLQFKYSQKSKKKNQRAQVNVCRGRERAGDRFLSEKKKKLLIDVRDIVGAVLCDLYRNLYRAHSNWTIWETEQREGRGREVDGDRDRDDYGISWGLAHVC